MDFLNDLQLRDLPRGDLIFRAHMSEGTNQAVAEWIASIGFGPDEWGVSEVAIDPESKLCCILALETDELRRGRQAGRPPMWKQFEFVVDPLPWIVGAYSLATCGHHLDDQPDSGDDEEWMCLTCENNLMWEAQHSS